MKKIGENMSYKIVVDSCCELPKEWLDTGNFERVPLGLEVGEYQIQDDESFIRDVPNPPVLLRKGIEKLLRRRLTEFML